MRALVALGFALGLPIGCTPVEALEQQPCVEKAECGRELTCVRTPEEEAAALPGACLAQDASCLVGEQLGCACDPSASEGCNFADRPQPDDYPDLACEPTLAVCVLASSLPEGETEP